jgi:hypothetical protein
MINMRRQRNGPRISAPVRRGFRDFTSCLDQARGRTPKANADILELITTDVKDKKQFVGGISK